MKKLLLTFYLFFSLIAQAQSTLIPDANFEQRLIDLGYDDVLDGSVLTSNINGVVSLDISLMQIEDITGIQDFVSLDTLNCSGNYINNLDSIANIELISLDCSDNSLFEVNFANNAELRDLNCANIALNLDVSNNLLLESLNCSITYSTGVDVSNNVLLKKLICSTTDLGSLDLSNNPLLEELDVHNDYIASNLYSLDVSNNPQLKKLVFYGNKLTSIDLSNNPNLIELNCTWNDIPFLDLTPCTNLEKLYATFTDLINVDLSNNSKLWYIDVSMNNLTQLDLSNCDSMKVVIAGSNPNLSCLNIKNGFTTQLSNVHIYNAPNVSCIQVDDPVWATNNLSNSNNSQATFSDNCFECSVGLEELQADNIKLVKVVDLLGRETTLQKNMLLFKVYSDGTSQKVYIGD